MGRQYLGKLNQFTGDYGAYAIKKQRITRESVEKLVRKYYKMEGKQRRMLEMIYRKLDNLGELGEMFSSYSRLYLYEKEQNRDSEFQSDYLLVHENGKKILHLGFVKKQNNKKKTATTTDFFKVIATFLFLRMVRLIVGLQV